MSTLRGVVVPLDQWIEEHAKQLAVDIRCHIDEMVDGQGWLGQLGGDDKDDVVRHIMTSIRAWIPKT